MIRTLFRYVVFAFVTVASLAARPTGQPESSLVAADGQRLGEKLALIVENAAVGSRLVEPIIVYQREINSFLRYQAAPELPPGVSEIEVDLSDSGQVSVFAIVDLSTIRSDQSPDSLGPLQYLSGRLPVAVQGLVWSESGVGRFDIQSVTIGSISVPPSAISNLIHRYSRNEERPDGIDLDESFDLPYGVTEVRVEHERAIVIQ